MNLFRNARVSVALESACRKPDEPRLDETGTLVRSLLGQQMADSLKGDEFRCEQVSLQCAGGGDGGDIVPVSPEQQGGLLYGMFDHGIAQKIHVVFPGA